MRLSEEEVRYVADLANLNLSEDEVRFVRDMVIYEDPSAFVLNKPPGLATQGGTKTTHHLDRLLDGLADDRGRPKLVHRLDKDTSGALLVARTARAAGHFAKAFSGRTAKKVYWALVVGVPDLAEGTIAASGAIPMSPLFDRRTTLKDALSMLLDATVQAGILVDRQGRVRGLVTAGMIADWFRADSGRALPVEPVISAESAAAAARA
jgi:hypothetical protein